FPQWAGAPMVDGRFLLMSAGPQEAQGATTRAGPARDWRAVPPGRKNGGRHPTLGPLAAIGREARQCVVSVSTWRRGGLVPDAWACEGDPLLKQRWDKSVQRRKERGSMRRTFMNVVAVASLFLMASVLSAAAQPPDAILKVHTASIAVGVGYSWGGGIVTF